MIHPQNQYIFNQFLPLGTYFKILVDKFVDQVVPNFLKIYTSAVERGDLKFNRAENGVPIPMEFQRMEFRVSLSFESGQNFRRQC